MLVGVSKPMDSLYVSPILQVNENYFLCTILLLFPCPMDSTQAFIDYGG